MTVASFELLALLQEWDTVKNQIAEFKPTIDREMELRKRVFELAFPAPKEGVNTFPLPNDWKLKGTYKLDRKIDEAALESVREQLRKQGVNPDPLIKWKPELVTGDYKALSKEAKAIFDQALTTKPASPTVELIQPKEKAA